MGSNAFKETILSFQRTVYTMTFSPYDLFSTYCTITFMNFFKILHYDLFHTFSTYYTMTLKKKNLHTMAFFPDTILWLFFTILLHTMTFSYFFDILYHDFFYLNFFMAYPYVPRAAQGIRGSYNRIKLQQNNQINCSTCANKYRIYLQWN